MSDIKSRETIKNDLILIAEKSGYSGSQVDFVINLISTGYYDSLINTVSLNNESNAETAAGTNSLLNLCCERKYSAFRGSNPKYKVMASSSVMQTLTRGLKIAEFTDYNVYVEKDVVMEPYIEVEVLLILSKKFINVSLTGTTATYLRNYLVRNLSEDILITSMGVEIPYTKTFSTHIKDKIIFAETTVDWGVRLSLVTPSINEFTMQGFQYQDVADGSLTILEDVNLEGVTFNVPSTQFTPGNLRETNLELSRNYNLQVESLYIIRATSDLLDTFNQRFVSKSIGSNMTQVDEGGVPIVHFYYIPKYSFSLITGPEFDQYELDVKMAFLADDFQLHVATEIPLKLNVSLRSLNNTATRDAINAYVDSINNVINQSITLPQLLTYISKMSSVSELITIQLLDVTNTPIMEADADPISYFKMISNVNFVYD